MDGSIILRRLAALMRSSFAQAAPARHFDGGVSAEQALRSYKWSYIRLAALHLSGRIIEVSGQRGGKFSTRARHFPGSKVLGPRYK